MAWSLWFWVFFRMRWVGFASLLTLVACGVDHGVEDVHDIAETGLPEVAEPDSEVSPDTAPEPAEVVEPTCPEPLTQGAELVFCEGPCFCPDDCACDVWLGAHGVCPGRCVRVSKPLSCEGVIRWGACLGRDLRAPGYPSIELPRHTVRVVSGPNTALPARVGERHRISIEVTAKSGESTSLRFGFADTGIHLVEPEPWMGTGPETRLEVPGDAPLVLTLEVTARVATQLIERDPPFATFTFDGVPFSPGFPVIFASDGATGTIECGGYSFPRAWDEASGVLNSPARYRDARCCGEVFFAEAECCDDSECGAGRCIDGACQTFAPASRAATRLPLGHVRVRAFFPLAYGRDMGHGVNDFRDFCTDRADELRDVLRLDDAQAWFDDLAMRRLGRTTVELDWTVSAIDRDRFEAMDPNVWHSPDFRALLDQHLSELGCEPLAESDLVLIAGVLEEPFESAERQDRGFLLYFDSQYRPSARLARMFGGAFERPSYTLMSQRLPDCLIAHNHTEPLPPYTPLPCKPLPGDQLVWGALGFSDLDRDGVIDIAQHAAYPSGLVLQNVRATLSERALLVAYEVAARDGKHIRRRVVTDHTLHLPELGLVRPSTSNRRTHTVEVPLSQDELATLSRSAELTVRVTARDAYFDPEWRQHTLALDETRTVPLSPLTE